MYSKGKTKQWRESCLESFVKSNMNDPEVFHMAMCRLKASDFFTAPASTRFHSAYEGGLFDHCINVTQSLIQLTHAGVTSFWQRQESPVIVGLLHDSTKIGAYLWSDEQGWTHNPYKTQFGTHGEDSLQSAFGYMILTPEEQACIRWHMGAYEGPEAWDGFDKAIKEYPNVLWTHTADMVASKLMEE